MSVKRKFAQCYLFHQLLIIVPLIVGQTASAQLFPPDSQLCQWSNQDKSDPNAVVPDGALLNQPNPVFCLINNSGPGTAQANFFGPNSWFDDFDHGLSFASLANTTYKIFENVDDGLNASIHWRHANHWMTDIHRDSTHTRGGTTISPNQAFKFKNGKLIVESIFAAGHQDYNDLEAWGEITISTAPAPQGFLGNGSVYSYEMFKGHWTFGCRLPGNRAPKCALMDDTGRTTVDRGNGSGRVWEASFFQRIGTNLFGGNPRVKIPGTNVRLGEYYRACDADQDADTLCRDKFRLELAQNSIKLYINGRVYWEQSGEFDTGGVSVNPDQFYKLRDPVTGELNFFPQEWINAPQLYVYFSSMSSARNQTNELFRYHWDDIAINPTTPPNAVNVPNFTDPLGSPPVTTSPTNAAELVPVLIFLLESRKID